MRIARDGAIQVYCGRQQEQLPHRVQTHCKAFSEVRLINITELFATILETDNMQTDAKMAPLQRLRRGKRKRDQDGEEWRI